MDSEYICKDNFLCDAGNHCCGHEDTTGCHCSFQAPVINQHQQDTPHGYGLFHPVETWNELALSDILELPDELCCFSGELGLPRVESPTSESCFDLDSMLFPATGILASNDLICSAGTSQSGGNKEIYSMPHHPSTDQTFGFVSLGSSASFVEDVEPIVFAPPMTPHRRSVLIPNSSEIRKRRRDNEDEATYETVENADYPFEDNCCIPHSPVEAGIIETGVAVHDIANYAVPNKRLRDDRYASPYDQRGGNQADEEEPSDDGWSTTGYDIFSEDHCKTETESKSKERREDSIRKYQASRWAQKFEELLEYQHKFGHCLVPYTYTENPGLAGWVKRQRYQYKILREGNESSNMTSERITALEEIGFVWDSQGCFWMERLQELKAFKASFGHCNVPSSFPGSKSLATWVKGQRKSIWKKSLRFVFLSFLMNPASYH
jgi:Helicase associated domain